MKPGERLRDVDPEFARLVLALKGGEPQRSSIDKTLSALAAGAAVSPLSAPLAPRPIRRTWALVGLGVTVLALTSAGYQWSRDDAAGASVGVAPTARSEAPPVAVDEAPVIEPPALSVRVEDLPPAPVAPAKPKPLAAPSATGMTGMEKAPPVDSFRDELALVERIRRQLSRGEAEACLQSIDAYGKEHREGAFVQEVAAMRVEALAAAGKRDAAGAAGRQFLSQYPTSPYAGRVRSVLDRSQ